MISQLFFKVARKGGLHTVTSPLTEERNTAVACKTVSGGSVLEERAVIPPSLVGTIELQMSLIFPHLKSDPFAVGVAISVVLGEECLGLLLLAVGVEPLKLVSLSK